MWAFEAHGGVPDVVTLGKPIGNGYPLGAVVTTREIAEAFAHGVEYFNTFGGSPVACAAGLAVLDILRDEDWRQHALEVGRYLQGRFAELADRHPVIGDIRGRGLFLGVDLVRDASSREPATELAGDLVEALRCEGILLSTEGPGHNVLKIKPPLPFTTEDADELADAVDRYLARVG
jgi:4-aminobutyrate aminotransferase-like enzyme